MGVLEPVDEAFHEEVPATPPGFRDLEIEENSEDDLFAEDKPAIYSYNHDLSFKDIVPVLPSKGDFDDLLGMQSITHNWRVQPPTNKSKGYCSRCFARVKEDLKKLANVVENVKNERDTLKEENSALKKEVEELKKILSQKEEAEKGDVKLYISNSNEDSVEVLVRKRNFENARSIFSNKEDFQKKPSDNTKGHGIKSFSINLSKANTDFLPTTNKKILEKESEIGQKPTVVQLRKAFFEKEFESEQKTFTSSNFLEIKPEEKSTFRSRLAIRVKPKQKITEIISKLTSKIGGAKVTPREAPPITMFQRFDKTRTVWESDVKHKVRF